MLSSRFRQPVNKFPDFVGYLVRRLKVLCPTMGKTRIANVLCRAGLHLGSTTIRRMLKDQRRPKPGIAASESADRIVTARRPESRLACRSDSTVPTVPRLLDSVAPSGTPAALALLLVDRRRRRSLLPARDGCGSLPEAAHL